MTTQSDFDRFVESQRGIRRLVLRDLAAWWATVEGLSPSEAKRKAREFLPVLARTYGEVSAAAAADFYEASRADSPGARGRFTATMARSDAASYARKQASWAVSPIFGGDPAGALGRMSIVADKAALQQGRNTIIHNAKRDPSKPRWARVTVGKTCACCVMLASRGAVYRSEDTARGAHSFHGGHCDCQPVASWDNGGDLPPSYDEGHLYGLYSRAQADAGSMDPKAITKALRRLDGGVHVTDGVAPSL